MRARLPSCCPVVLYCAVCSSHPPRLPSSHHSPTPPNVSTNPPSTIADKPPSTIPPSTGPTVSYGQRCTIHMHTTHPLTRGHTGPRWNQEEPLVWGAITRYPPTGRRRSCERARVSPAEAASPRARSDGKRQDHQKLPLIAHVTASSASRPRPVANKPLHKAL